MYSSLYCCTASHLQHVVPSHVLWRGPDGHLGVVHHQAHLYRSSTSHKQYSGMIRKQYISTGTGRAGSTGAVKWDVSSAAQHCRGESSETHLTENATNQHRQAEKWNDSVTSAGCSHTQTQTETYEYESHHTCPSHLGPLPDGVQVDTSVDERCRQLTPPRLERVGAQRDGARRLRAVHGTNRKETVKCDMLRGKGHTNYFCAA